MYKQKSLPSVFFIDCTECSLNTTVNNCAFVKCNALNWIEMPKTQKFFINKYDDEIMLFYYRFRRQGEEMGYK